MFERIIEFSFRNKITVLLITLGIMLWCILGLKDLAIDAVPDITNVQVQVNAKTKSLDPESIELQVTRKIETELSGLSGLTDMRSISKFGLSQVNLIFEDGTDIYRARQQVSERIQNVELPKDVTIELAPITTGLGEVYMYTLELEDDSPLKKLSEKDQLTELRTLQDYTVKPVLKRVHGVADVDSNGGFVKEIHINFLPAKMEGIGFTLNQLLMRLESLGISAGGGYIQTKKEQVIVRTFPEMKSVEEISDLPLGISPVGKSIKLSDLSDVRVDHSLRVGAATHNGKEAVLGTVLMRVGSNGRAVVSGVEEALKELKLPKGIRFVPLYSRKFLVDNTIKTVITSLIEGAILVIAVLLVLLGSIKAALIVALAIPLSMLVALKGMSLLGITGNLMSLGAIDFGLLVDGSVVIIESILAHLALSHSESREDVIKRSGKEVLGPVVAGIILIMAVYLPILTLEGVEGKMFRPMAITVLLALGASLVTAVFLMPLLAEVFIKIDPSHDHETWFFKKAHKLFEPLLNLAMKRPKPFFISAFVLAMVAGVLFSRIGSDFIPELDEGDLVLGLTRNPRISVDASVEEQLKAEDILKKFPEVKSVFARLGTPESATDPMGVNLADTFLILEKDRSKWRFETKEDLIEALMKSLNGLPETDVSATQPIAMRFNEMLEGSRADLSLRVIGPDLADLFDYGQKAESILLPVKGVESIEQDPLTALRRSTLMDIKPDFHRLAAYGITVDQLNSSVEMSLAGRKVGSFQENNIRFPIVVHLDESLRDDPKQIEILPIELPLGGTIPLNKVANVKKEEKVTTIARNWGRRYSAISINVAGRDIGSLVNEAKQKIDKELGLKKGYELHWGGQFKNMERANARLMIIVPLTLAVVFLVLLKVFGSLGPAILVFSSVPFAGIGGIFALTIRGINFSVSAGVGFIALIGIAILNSLVLINVLLKESSSLSLEEAVKHGTLSRLRPVLMTALVAGLGFLPMALNKGLGAEVQRPLATVVIGGLVTSTFLTLVLLPVAFYHWKKRSQK
ncbi:MAG: efflux RND transporter permease subunit [Bacteriovoracaceae bacterium]